MKSSVVYSKLIMIVSRLAKIRLRLQIVFASLWSLTLVLLETSDRCIDGILHFSLMLRDIHSIRV